MYKLQTQLTHFRFNSIHNYGPYIITWYKLNENDQVINGICFTHNELQILTNYVCNNKVNFNSQNHVACDPEDAPFCSIYDFLPSDNPKNLIIRKSPQLNKVGGVIFSCMDIELLNEKGALNHNYNLEFDIIGRIEI